MKGYNNKIWVSDLSEKALAKLKRLHRKQLEGEGIYTEKEIENNLKDIETSKLTSIEDTIGKQLLKQLASE